MESYALEKIISGGQSGADRAGLDAALAFGIPVGGSCPRGRRAEDGAIPDCYPLVESRARTYGVRTRMNVRAADGTLVLNLGALSGGTLATIDYAEKRKKPCLVVQLDDGGHVTLDMVAEWLKTNDICTLNVAGPREGKAPGVYTMAFSFLERLFVLLRSSSSP